MNEPHVATIDLGSNSFHMAIARYQGDSLRIVDRLKEQVRLAEGLDERQQLSEEAMARGLACLRLFGERLRGFSAGQVRVAGTFTLREASNAGDFLRQASQALGFPIDIISGNEEARLIYQGVAHTQHTQGQMLVIDIGGGSTELVIGQGFDCKLVSSHGMGCVSFTRQYFADGHLNEQQFIQASDAAHYLLAPVLSSYINMGWDQVLGCSGTIKTLLEMCSAITGEQCIDLPGLLHIRAQLIAGGHIDQIAIAGLSEDRKPLIAAGLSILLGLFQGLNLNNMAFSDGALREGLLYTAFGRQNHSPIQNHTLHTLSHQYGVDTQQAARVCDTALELFSQLHQRWQLNETSAELLATAALLHEVGLHINFTGIHRHSAYILRHSDLPGFNLEQQKALAALVRFHRKALKLSELEPLADLPEGQLWRLVRILRLAVALNRGRQNKASPVLRLELDEQDSLRLQLPAAWCQHNQMLLTTLQREQEYQAKVGWQLTLVTG